MLKIAVGLPTNRLIKPKTALSVLKLVAHLKLDYHFLVSTKGYNTSENRNYIAAQAVKNDCTHLFFVDDDMILPEDTLDRLLAHDKDIVGAIYKTKYETQAEVIEYLNDERPTELFKCGALGTGCLLIKTEVFKNLPQPWFKYEWNPNGSVKRSHDWIFCEDARNQGYDIWADPTLEVGHLGIKLF